MSLRKIFDRIDKKNRKINYSLQNTLNNPSSIVFCDECHNRLSITKMIFKARKVDKGEKYYITCKNCGCTNMRIKGDLSDKIDADWDQFGV
jgi:RNase P subunit RPR2